MPQEGIRSELLTHFFIKMRGSLHLLMVISKGLPPVSPSYSARMSIANWLSCSPRSSINSRRSSSRRRSRVDRGEEEEETRGNLYTWRNFGCDEERIKVTQVEPLVRTQGHTQPTAHLWNNENRSTQRHRRCGGTIEDHGGEMLPSFFSGVEAPGTPAHEEDAQSRTEMPITHPVARLVVCICNT